MIKKIIFLEGLPGVGKTTIVNNIKNLKLKNVFTIDEIVKEDIKNRVSDNEKDYMENDDMKIMLTNKNGIIIMDRGPISTLSYNQARNIIDKNFDKNMVEKWFEKIQNIYSENHVILFLTNKGEKYTITSNQKNDPYGSIKNQQLLESITLYNCFKYSKNVIVKEYHQQNIMEVINEIIN